MHRSVLFALPILWLCPRLVFATSQWTSESSRISYRVVHKMHEVVGTSHNVTAVAQMNETHLQVMARAPVDSFLSGNANRDAHMLEVVDAHHYSTVAVRAVAPILTLPPAGSAADVPMDVEIELHGVKTYKKIVAHLQRDTEFHLKVQFTIDDSLEGHHIERPKLLFIPVDDVLHIVGDIDMRSKA